MDSSELARLIAREQPLHSNLVFFRQLLSKYSYYSNFRNFLNIAARFFSFNEYLRVFVLSVRDSALIVADGGYMSIET